MAKKRVDPNKGAHHEPSLPHDVAPMKIPDQEKDNEVSDETIIGIGMPMDTTLWLDLQKSAEEHMEQE